MSIEDCGADASPDDDETSAVMIVVVLDGTTECGLSKRMLFRSSSIGNPPAPILPCDVGLVGLDDGRCDWRFVVLDVTDEGGVDENSVAACVRVEIKFRLR